jgi:hypothetical protein
MVISMIFDLATLTIAVMAFTSTAIAQIEAYQFNVYFDSTDCNSSSYSYSMYTNNSVPAIFEGMDPENKCHTAACSSSDPQNQPLRANRNTSVYFFNNATGQSTSQDAGDPTLISVGVYATTIECDSDQPFNYSQNLLGFVSNVEAGCKLLPQLKSGGNMLILGTKGDC